MEPGVAQRVRIVARLVQSPTVSGQEIARLLGISRAAVHKHIELLRASGIDLHSRPGSGYSLTIATDSLVPEVALTLLLGLAGTPEDAGWPAGLPYVYVPKTPSTNALLKELVQNGVRSGAMVVSDEQVAGRGRLGRVWVSEAGKDLTFSLAVRPRLASDQAHLLVLAASVAVAETLRSIPGLEGRVGIKWPNDVLVDGRKVCGILSEASMDMDRLHWAILGVGINVNGSPARLVDPRTLPSGQPAPSSLREAAGAAVPRGLLLALLARSLRRRLGEVEHGGWPGVLEGYRALDVLAGTTVTVRGGADAGELIATGTVLEIGGAGELLVREADGTVVGVFSGEVTLGDRSA